MRTGGKPPFLTVSFVGTDDLILRAEAGADRTVVTQVVPPYYLTDPGQLPGFVSLEGFVDAMAMIAEGLKRAGKDLNARGFDSSDRINSPDGFGTGAATEVGFVA